MKNVILVLGLLLILPLVSGCAGLDYSTDHSGHYDGGSGSHGGHSH